MSVDPGLDGSTRSGGAKGGDRRDAFNGGGRDAIEAVLNVTVYVGDDLRRREEKRVPTPLNAMTIPRAGESLACVATIPTRLTSTKTSMALKEASNLTR